MLITKLQLAAMSRVDIPEEQRKDFYLYVDEFQNFATESFANILSEARKYHLSLILAHQYITQVPEEVSDAVFGNVGTMIIFRVGATDAEFLEKEFTPEFTVDDLVNLGFAQIYLKLMIDGFASRPFSATTLPPLSTTEKSNKEKIIRISRERYSSQRQEVEEKIIRWSGMSIEEDRKMMPEKSAGQPIISSNYRPAVSRPTREQIFIDRCSECGRKVELNFKPDGVRPVYCKDCLAQVRSKTALQGVPKMAKMGESVLKQTGEPVSLGEALKQGAAEFKTEKRKRKEVDLNELRQVLSEVVGPQSQNEVTSVQPKPQPKSTDNQNGEKELRPGETVEL
jgi:CxxC-x17-CxxC domain-containing protein